MKYADNNMIHGFVLITVVFLAIIINTASAQNYSNGFNFYLPPNDTLTTRFIPQFPKIPLTDQDFVSIDPQGHFSVRGTPKRFFGVNAGSDLSHPDKADAPLLAGRIRKMGFNLVRFGNDGCWPGSIFEMDPFKNWWTDTRHLNPVTLNQLEKVISALKENGIYADIILLASRRFLETDGVQNADSIWYAQQKYFVQPAAIFDPQLIALQKEYANLLLTHVNPYTGLALINDPVMAMVEIQNENSLHRIWRQGGLQSIQNGGSLIARHVRILDSLWNDYLLQKYTTTETLGNTWSHGAEDQIQNGSFETGDINTNWQLDLPSPGTACATMSLDAENPHSGTNCARLDVQKVDGENWHIVFRQENLSIIKDSVYTVQFSARSNSTRLIGTDIWGNTQYTYYPFTATPGWQTFGFVFRAPESCIDQVKINFYLGSFENADTIWFDDIIMYKSGGKGLDPDESLSDRSVKRIAYHDCPYYTEQRVRDISEFYETLQSNFFTDMLHYLKDTLGVKVPIEGTNLNVGPGDLAAQSQCDYIDNHVYGGSDELVMCQDQKGGTITFAMAGVPMKNKPYTISEYQEAWPCRYQSEGPLLISAYSSFHDIDGLSFHCYQEDFNGYGSADWETDIQERHFAIHRNSALMTLMPSCAYAYRHGLISKAEQTVYLRYSPDDYLTFPKYDTWWPTDAEPFPKTIAIEHAVRTETFESPTPIDYAAISDGSSSNPYISDTHELTWNTDGLLSVASGRFAGFTGLLNNFVNSSAGPMTIKTASGFGTLTWISLTTDSLQKADRSLLTISTRVNNTGMVWDGVKVVDDQYGTSSTQVEPLAITLQLTIKADSIRVYPLDTLGRETRGYATYHPSPLDTFTVNIDQSQSKTMWFGIERFKNNQKPVLNSRTPNTLDRVIRNTPQTFSVNVTAPTDNPVTYEWKVNGVTEQTGSNSSCTKSFTNSYNAPMLVTVVFSISDDMKDSTTWDFKIASLITVDGEKDAFYNTLTGSDNGYLQIRSDAFNDIGKPKDDADLSVKLWTAWDNEWFYLYEEIRDNIVSGNAPEVWDEDCIELKIDPQPTDSIANSIWDTRLTALSISAAGVVNADSMNGISNSKKQWARKTIPGGYALELAIKWTVIQSGTETITPAVDSVFGLAINQHDNDGQGLLASVQWAAVLTNAVYNTAKYLGTVQFLLDNKLKFIPRNNMTGVTNPISYDDPNYYPKYIVIDGNKDAFFGTLKIPDDGYLQLRSYAYNENGIPSNDADLSAKIWTAWDNGCFFLYEEVSDDTISGNAANVWEEDCIELNFDPMPTDSLTNSVWQTRLTALGKDNPGVVATDSINNVADSLKQYVRKIIPGGYALELALRWPAINGNGETITPAIGNIFGMAINQHDNDGRARRQATVQWAAVLRDGVWNTPKYLGTVKFLADHKLQFIPRNHMTGATNPVPYDGSDYIRTGIGGILSNIPKEFQLDQNYPNPFNPSTTFRYGLPSRSIVKFKIYNILGQMIAELVNAEQQAGYQFVTWDAKKVASGMYFYRIEAADATKPSNQFMATKKMLLLK